MLGRLATVVAVGLGFVALLVGWLGLVGVYDGVTAAGCDGPVGPCPSPVIYVPKLLLGAGGLLLARSLVRWSP